MLSKFVYLQRQDSTPTQQEKDIIMNINNFDGLKIHNNNNTNVNNHSNRDIELMMELPPASPMSHVSHVSHATTTHRSVSQCNNGSGNGHQSAVLNGADELQKLQSLSLSRATLNSKELGVEKSITAMGILALIAIILSALSILLLIQFNSIQDQDMTDETAVIGVTGTRWYSDVLDSAVVLVSFCLMLNLSCVVVCSGQCYFTAKMLKLPQGEERSYEFLKNTSGSRFLAVCSFFVSIPIFLIALCLLILLEFRTTPAIVSSALIGLAILFMIFSFGHNVHLWRREQTEINKRHAPPPGVFTDMNGGLYHHHHHHNHNQGNGHRFAYTNAGIAGEGAGVDPLSVSNLSTLV
ncbi:uncharacterized protein [Diadema antillarum]|uniref:uncharacterized protein n=1 Tax=Diadema antillarum TaxID=105358 RepID=UPI003A8814F0